MPEPREERPKNCTTLPGGFGLSVDAKRRHRQTSPYAVPTRRADESIPDPKGRESRTPTDFPLHDSRFCGPRGGAIMAILDPLTSRRRILAKDMPPLREYFLPV
jgi:hypothetical protein